MTSNRLKITEIVQSNPWNSLPKNEWTKPNNGATITNLWFVARQYWLTLSLENWFRAISSTLPLRQLSCSERVTILVIPINSSSIIAAQHREHRRRHSHTATMGVGPILCPTIPIRQSQVWSWFEIKFQLPLWDEQAIFRWDTHCKPQWQYHCRINCSIRALILEWVRLFV